MTAGRPSNTDVTSHFIYSLNPNTKTQQAKCRYCNLTRAKNTSRQAEHLQKCKPFLEAHPERSDPSQGPKPEKRTAAAIADRLSNDEKTILDDMFATAVYAGNHPFTIFQEPHMKAALKSIRPAHKPPTAAELANTLLNKQYDKIKSAVESSISNGSHLSFTTDAWTNIKNQRILNLCVVTDDTTLFYNSEDSGAEQHTAANLAAWIKKNVMDACGNDITKVITLPKHDLPSLLVTVIDRSILSHCPRSMVLSLIRVPRCAPPGPSLNKIKTLRKFSSYHAVLTSSSCSSVTF